MYKCNTCKVSGSADELDAHSLNTYNKGEHSVPHYSYRPVK